MFDFIIQHETLLPAVGLSSYAIFFCFWEEKRERAWAKKARKFLKGRLRWEKKLIAHRWSGLFKKYLCLLKRKRRDFRLFYPQKINKLHPRSASLYVHSIVISSAIEHTRFHSWIPSTEFVFVKFFSVMITKRRKHPCSLHTHN